MHSSVGGLETYVHGCNSLCNHCHHNESRACDRLQFPRGCEISLHTLIKVNFDFACAISFFGLVVLV